MNTVEMNMPEFDGSVESGRKMVEKYLEEDAVCPFSDEKLTKNNCVLMVEFSDDRGMCVHFTHGAFWDWWADEEKLTRLANEKNLCVFWFDGRVLFSEDSLESGMGFVAHPSWSGWMN